MTLRTTSASKRQHRPGHDERRSLYLNLAFVGAIVASIAILLGAAGVTYYTDHLGQVAKVNGKVITRDDLRARIAVDTWRIDNAEKILSNLIANGHLTQDEANTQAQPLEAERKKLLAEVRAANQEARVYKLEDVNKGWYRLSTERAMQIVAEEWRDPAAGKEKLVKRFESSQKQVSFE